MPRVPVLESAAIITRIATGIFAATRSPDGFAEARGVEHARAMPGAMR